VPLPPQLHAGQTRTEEPEQRGRGRDGAKDPALRLDHLDRVLMVRPIGRAAAIFQQQTFEPPDHSLGASGCERTSRELDSMPLQAQIPI
jgi:hypothetical protein